MQVFPIKTPLIKPKDNLTTLLLQALKKHRLTLKNRDIVAVSSKALTTAQGRVVKLDEVPPSKKAVKLAQKHSLEPQFAELILHEAEKIYGGVDRAVLTLKHGVLTVNAGIDHKNAPAGHAALWPLKPQQSAEVLRSEIKRKTGKNVSILVVDSEVAPLRMGTRGLALAVAGFKPVEDRRGDKDLFQKPLVITRHAVADDLAASAHLLMGETNEKIPFALIRGAPITLTDKPVSPEDMQIPPEKCVYASAFKISTTNLKPETP